MREKTKSTNRKDVAQMGVVSLSVFVTINKMLRRGLKRFFSYLSNSEMQSTKVEEL